MFDFTKPLPELVAEVKSELLNWSQQQRPILQYRFGFYRLPFYADRLTDGCAIHVWLADLPRDEFPHTHIFELTSRVLRGGLENTNWNITERPDGNFRLIEPVCTDTLCTDTVTDRFCNATVSEKDNIGVGDLYGVRRGIFHTTKILEFPTITIIKRAKVDACGQPAHLAPRNEFPRTFDFTAQDPKAWAKVRSTLELL
jgi:hypothetical protein